MRYGSTGRTPTFTPYGPKRLDPTVFMSWTVRAMVTVNRVSMRIRDSTPRDSHRTGLIIHSTRRRDDV